MNKTLYSTDNRLTSFPWLTYCNSTVKKLPIDIIFTVKFWILIFKRAKNGFHKNPFSYYRPVRRLFCGGGHTFTKFGTKTFFIKISQFFYDFSLFWRFLGGRALKIYQFFSNAPKARAKNRGFRYFSRRNVVYISSLV